MSNLDTLIKNMNREAKRTVISEKFEYTEYERFKFSSPRVNYSLYGGLPRGVLIEFWGDQNDGKTTTIIDLIKNAQIQLKAEWKAIAKDKRPPKPKKVIFIDAENTFDMVWAKTNGVDIKDLILWVPDEETYAEKLFDQILEIINTDEVGLVVLDSLGVLVSEQMHNKTVEEKTMAGIAAPLKMFSRKAIPLLRKTQCTLVAINQVITEFDPMTGRSRLIPTGGKGWRHNISLSLRFRKGTYFDADYGKLTTEATDPRGHFVKIFISKTKLFPPNRRNCQYPLNYISGVDADYDVLQMAIEYGYVLKSGGWHTLCNIKTGEVDFEIDGKLVKANGSANFLNMLKELNLFAELEDAIYERGREIPKLED